MSRRPRSNIYQDQNEEIELLSNNCCVGTFYDNAETGIRRRSTWLKRFSGWRGGFVASITISALVLLLNVVLAAAATQWRKINGIANIWEGDCTLTTRWMVAIHLIINLLSSMLLGASNYCMQRLVAPTRKEVDKAHNQKKWLDIGVPGVANLTSISKSRLVSWILLALSSIPLHFLYNSVIFQTIAAIQVQFFVVTENYFTTKLSPGLFSGYSNDFQKDASEIQKLVLDGQYLNRTAFDNITLTECESRYNAQFINVGYGFGVLPPDSQYHLSANNSVFTSFAGIGQLGIHSTTYNLTYCLSQKMPAPSCKIQLSQTVLYIVIACNILKVAVMAFTLWRVNNETTIVTLGDAIKSFLQTPDNTTKNVCLMSRQTVDWLWKASPEVQFSQKFKTRRRQKWGVACSHRRWTVSLLLYLAAIMMAASFIAPVSANFDGFGMASTEYTIGIKLPLGNTSVIPYILLANLPQAIISLIYLQYNGQFTAMLAHREWSNYAVKRAPLRVTIPSSSQRSTYYLQLPYTFSVPLLSAAVLLHWFISQGIFLVRIIVYQDGKPIRKFDQDGDFYSSVGYSTSALVASIIWGSLMILAVLVVALYAKYPIGLPVGINSAVISAACHIQHEEKEGKDVSDRPLKWGVTIPGTEETAGHCSFSSGEVDSPKFGCLYAGCHRRSAGGEESLAGATVD